MAVPSHTTVHIYTVGLFCTTAITFPLCAPSFVLHMHCCLHNFLYLVVCKFPPFLLSLPLFLLTKFRFYLVLPVTVGRGVGVRQCFPVLKSSGSTLEKNLSKFCTQIKNIGDRNNGCPNTGLFMVQWYTKTVFKQLIYNQQNSGLVNECHFCMCV